MSPHSLDNPVATIENLSLELYLSVWIAQMPDRAQCSPDRPIDPFSSGCAKIVSLVHKCYQ
ncbi:hypothetical protein [Microcoleus sp. EPA2]|uniref:hypothetical protein n=1 Tax=Microcoleus sp. EPA2 TaxID=2841654 RepID=UPI00312B3606